MPLCFPPAAVALPLSLLLATACSSGGFHRDQLRTALDAPPEVTDQEIAKTLALKPQLPKPFRVGVYFQAPESRGGSAKALWRWREPDKQKILSAADKLVTAGEISQIFELSSAVATRSDLRSLRLAAARHGADALLVVGGANETDSRTNGWGWTYVAIVPALFVPATEMNVLFLSRATLWDVRNQFLYLSAEGEGESAQTRPYAYTNEREAVGAAMELSLSRLKDSLEKMAAGLGAERQASRGI